MLVYQRVSQDDLILGWWSITLSIYIYVYMYMYVYIMYYNVYIYICTHHLCRPWSLCLVVLDHSSFLLATCESLLMSSGHEKYQRSISSQLRMGMWLSSKGIAYTSNTPNWHISTPTGLFLNIFHVSLRIDYSHNTRTSYSIVRGNTARSSSSEICHAYTCSCGSKLRSVENIMVQLWFNSWNYNQNHQMFNYLFIILSDHSSTMVLYTVRTTIISIEKPIRWILWVHWRATAMVVCLDDNHWKLW
jgi:hypothetical protein